MLDHLFGQKFPSMFFIGIVRDGDQLKAEFGPKIFQTPDSPTATTTLFTASELDTARAIKRSAAVEFITTQRHRRQLKWAKQQLLLAEGALQTGEVTLDDFPAPESPSAAVSFSDKPEIAITLKAIYNARTNDALTPPTVHCDREEANLTEIFIRAAASENARLAKTPKPLPPPLQLPAP